MTLNLFKFGLNTNTKQSTSFLTVSVIGQSIKKNLVLGTSLVAIFSSISSPIAWAQRSPAKEQPSSRQALQKRVPVKTLDKQNLETSKEVRVKKTGDVLVVSFGPNDVTYWSFPESGGTAAPQSFTPSGKTGLKLNADGARGLYLSFENGTPPNYSIDVTGTMANPPSASSTLDNPAVYVAHDFAGIGQIKAGQLSGMQDFHGKAKIAAASLQSKAVALEADFRSRIQQHVSDSVQAVQGYKDQADAIIDLTRLTPQAGPGSKIEDILTRFKTQAETDKNEILSKRLGYAALIPDIDQIMQDCEQHERTLEGMVNNIIAADDADDIADEALNNGNGVADTDPDTPQPGGGYREEVMDDAENALEGCFAKAVADYKNLTPQNVPIPDVEDAPYLAFQTEADTFRNMMEAAADVFKADMEAPAVEAQFRLSPANELAYQADMLKVMLPIDTTGEIAGTLASISSGNVAVKGNLSKKKSKNKSSSTNKSLKSASSDICDAANYPGLLNFNVGKVAVLVGTPMNDKLTGKSGIDIVFGLGGDDCIKTKGGIDVVFGMQGDDSIDTGAHHDFATGNRGDDILMGGDGKDYSVPPNVPTPNFKVWLGNLLDGGGGDDTIYGWGEDAGNIKPWTDIIFGDGLAKPADHGKDDINGTGGIDFLFGQSKDDALSMDTRGKIILNAVEQKFGSFFFGDVGKDTITGSDNVDFAFGNAGDDTIKMGDGIDFAFGQKGGDTIDGESDFDILFGGPGDDVIEGGGIASIPNDPVAADAAAIADFEIIFGGEDNDQITDKEGQLSLLFGNIGDDYVYPRGKITLGFGNTGEDFILGGPFINLLFGGKHNDTLLGGNNPAMPNILSGDKGNDWVNGGENLVSLNLGGAGSDMILGGDPFKADPTNNPVVDLLDISLGNAGNDYIDGEGFVDLSFGGNGNDVVKGGNNRDDTAINLDVNISFGDQDNDCVLGGGVAEVLIGGAGDDILWNSGLIGVHLGLGGEDISFGGDFLLNSDIVLGDAGVDRANLLGGPDLVFGFGGDDHIKSDVALIAFAGDGDDHVEGGAVSNIIFGGDGNDHLGVQTVGQVNPLSVIFGGALNDLTQGGTYGFGNSGDDHMQEHRLSFGGQGTDRIKSRENMLVPFSLMMGGADNDMLMTSTDENSRDFGFGNKGDDKFDYGRGKNRAWGGKGDDEMTGFYEPQSGTDKRDRLRGGRDTDSAWGNSNDDPKKDKLKAESKNRGSGPTWAPLTAPTAPTPPTVSQPSCPQPTDFDRFKGATQVGSKLAYQDWMNDFWED